VFFFTFEATPAPDSEFSDSVGGAFVNCWVNFKRADGAELLARFYIEETGWLVGAMTESFVVNGDSYSDDPETMENYLEAEQNGISMVFYEWPRDAPEDHPHTTSGRTFDA
jgi:hypothetical protein